MPAFLHMDTALSALNPHVPLSLITDPRKQVLSDAGTDSPEQGHQDDQTYWLLSSE